MKVRCPLCAACCVAFVVLSNPSAHVLAKVTAGDVATKVAEWGDKLDLDQRIVGQIERYSREEDDLGDTYPRGHASDVRRLVFRDAVNALRQLPLVDGETSVEVTYLKPGFADPEGKEPDHEHQRDFEKGYIRIEVLATFKIEGVSPEEALREFTSREFRMETSSRIQRIWSEDDLSCIEVKGVKALLAPTLACNKIDELILPSIASQHSQVVSNPGGDSYQTVYYKESVKTFVEVPGGLVLHYINYTRAVKLGKIKRSLGRGRIVDSEEEKIRELRARLADGIK